MWPGLCQTVSEFSACFALKIGSVTVKLCDLGYVKLFPNFLCVLQWKLDEFSVGLFWTFGAVTGHVGVCVAMFCLFLFFVVAFLMMKINWQQQHKYKKKKKNKKSTENGLSEVAFGLMYWFTYPVTHFKNISFITCVCLYLLVCVLFLYVCAYWCCIPKIYYLKKWEFLWPLKW